MLQRTDHDRILELRLDRPPANAIVPELAGALVDALAEAAEAGRPAIVLSGAPGMYSAGLDVPHFLGLERAALARAWMDFFAMMRALVASPVPVVAAVTGHAPAGGCVLAMCCDWRTMASGRFKIGLNEVAVGVRVPRPILAVARHVVGPRQAERLCTQAELLSADEALRIGLVDELALPDEVVPRAVARAEHMASLPPATLRRTRALARREMVAALDAIDEDTLDQFLDEWSSRESQEALHALVARLKKG